MMQIKIYPAYTETKKNMKIIRLSEFSTLELLDSQIRKAYGKDEEDKFDFSDITHLSEFYVGKKPHKYKILDFKTILKDIYSNTNNLKYLFDFGEQHLFCIKLGAALTEKIPGSKP